MKPENVLIFYKPELHAKIADFSHSFLDTGRTRNLVGGSYIYAAPEWRASAPTDELLRTDIYSFGLLFSGLILGLDFDKSNLANDEYLGYESGQTPEEALQKLKDHDMMQIYIYNLILEADQERPDLHLEELPMIQTVLEATLQLDPMKRDLRKVIECLSGRFVPKHAYNMEERMLITMCSAPNDGRKLQKIEEYLAATAVRTRNSPDSTRT